MSENEPKYPVLTVMKAIQIIEQLSKINGNRGASIAELSRELNMGKSTVHRILDTLAYYGWVDQDHDTNNYRLGWEMYKLGQVVPLQNQLLNIDQNYLLDLSNATQAVVNLGVLKKGETIVISKVENAQEGVRVNANPIDYEAIHATALGKMLVSEKTEAEIEDILDSHGSMQAYTENTITTFPAFMEEIRKTRARGYSVDAQEWSLGMTCFAMPLRDYTGNIVAAISVSSSSNSMTEDRQAFILEKLKMTTDLLSRSLGYSA